jgi:hypothetical protein
MMILPQKLKLRTLMTIFLKIAENIFEKIKCDNSLKTNITTYSPYNLLQIFNLKYDSIRFNNTSMEEIKKIIKIFLGKILKVMMKYQ